MSSAYANILIKVPATQQPIPELTTYNETDTTIQSAPKSDPPKVVCHFLRNHVEF